MRKWTPEERAAHSKLVREMWTPEKREALGKKLRGKKRSAQTKARMREIALARPPVTEEVRERLSRAAKKRWQMYRDALEAQTQIQATVSTVPTPAPVPTSKPVCGSCGGTRYLAGDSLGQPLMDKIAWSDFVLLGSELTETIIASGAVQRIVCPDCRHV